MASHPLSVGQPPHQTYMTSLPAQAALMPPPPPPQAWMGATQMGITPQIQTPSHAQGQLMDTPPQIQTPSTLQGQLLNIEHCFCHVPLKKIQGKKDLTNYVVCGQVKTERSCTLFCKESEWPTLYQAILQQYPQGMSFHDAFPSCFHLLKCRVGINKAGTICYYSCRLQSDYTEYHSLFKGSGKTEKKEKF